MEPSHSTTIYFPRMRILNMVNPILFRLKLERCKLHNAVRHQTKCDIINDIKLFPTVYRRMYHRKFLMLSNQKSHYKSKCIRMLVFRAGIHNVLVKIANREDPEQTSSSEAWSALFSITFSAGNWCWKF